MKPHSIDLVALIFGVAFAMIGVAFLWGETVDTTVNIAWVGAVGFITLGAVALAATLARRPDESQPAAMSELGPRDLDDG